MTNPAPRPALRKAPDADLHPAHAESSTPVANDIRDLEIELTPAPTGIFDQYGGDLDRLATQTRARAEADPASILIIEEDSIKASKKHKEGKKKKDKHHNDKQGKKGKKHDKVNTRQKGKAKGSHSGERASQRIDLRVAVPAPVRRTLRAGTKGRSISENEAVDSAPDGRKSR